MSEMPKPIISYVVVTYKRPDFLPRCLMTIAGQVYRPLEVIVIDNGSDIDQSIIDPLHDAGIGAQVIDPGSNIGAGPGRNLGMQHAQGEIVVFIDDDAIIQEEEATTTLYQTLSEDPRRAAVTCYSCDPQGKMHPFEVPIQARQNPRSTDIIEVVSFTTMFCAMRKDTALSVGGFPPYLHCMEEYDLALRLLDAGQTIVYNGAASVVHHHAHQQGHTLRRVAKGALHCTLNRIRTAFRLLPFPFPWTMLVTRFVRLIWLSRGNLKLAADYIRTLFNERRTLRQNRRPISWKTIGYLLSIGGWNMLV